MVAKHCKAEVKERIIIIIIKQKFSAQHTMLPKYYKVDFMYKGCGRVGEGRH